MYFMFTNFLQPFIDYFQYAWWNIQFPFPHFAIGTLAFLLYKQNRTFKYPEQALMLYAVLWPIVPIFHLLAYLERDNTSIIRDIKNKYYKQKLLMYMRVHRKKLYILVDH
jgi:hypothetical protein